MVELVVGERITSGGGQDPSLRALGLWRSPAMKMARGCKGMVLIRRTPYPNNPHEIGTNRAGTVHAPEALMACFVVFLPQEEKQWKGLGPTHRRDEGGRACQESRLSY